MLRALVCTITQTILVVIGFGYTIVVFKSIIVLRLERGLVLCICVTVKVIVGIGAAVIVAKVVFVLCKQGTLIDYIRQSICICISRTHGNGRLL